MKGTFKVADNKDGTKTLWFSNRGKLLKVIRYSKELIGATGEEGMSLIYERDASLFYRGWTARE